jgi:hypothetical protein
VKCRTVELLSSCSIKLSNQKGGIVASIHGRDNLIGQIGELPDNLII